MAAGPRRAGATPIAARANPADHALGSIGWTPSWRWVVLPHAPYDKARAEASVVAAAGVLEQEQDAGVDAGLGRSNQGTESPPRG